MKHLAFFFCLLAFGGLGKVSADAEDLAIVEMNSH